MPKLPRMTASDAEKLLLDAGFYLARTKGSHRVYINGGRRVVVPYHSGKILHPKIIKQVLQGVDDTVILDAVDETEDDNLSFDSETDITNL